MDLMTVGIILAVGVGATLLVVFLGRVLNRTQPPTVAAPVTTEEPKELPPSTPRPQAEDASASERRIAPRRKGSAISVVVTDEQHSEPYRGWIVDRAANGLCLELDSAKEPGAILQLKPAEAPPATAWIPAEVRYCLAKGNVYYVGCQFLQTPPGNVLPLFG